MDIQIKRVYDLPSSEDGIRILIDSIWPRGIKKENLHYDFWLKDIAPSVSLRKWFAHDEKKWNEFKREYFAELDKKKDIVYLLRNIAEKQNLTLLFSAKNVRYNHAVALKEYMMNCFSDPLIEINACPFICISTAKTFDKTIHKKSTILTTLTNISPPY